MSKLIKIPNYQNPCEVIINGVKYQYPAGETCLVPDEVAMVIENVENNAPKYAKEYVRSPDIVETVSGEVITVSDSAEAPLQGLRVFGKTIQNGTPTPEAPVALESVGADGNVTVTLAGKNLADYDGRTGQTSMVDGDGFIVATNTSSAKTYVHVPIVAPYGEITVNIENVGGSDVYIQKSGSDYSISNTESFSRTINAEGWLRVMWSISPGVTSKVRIMAAKGKTALPYETYKGQNITISAPGGLSSIPVTSGGNYTDANGQQWICDEVDFEKGVYVQRVRNMTPGDIINSGLTLYGTNDAGIANFLIPLKGTVYEGVSLNLGLCSHMSKQSSMYADTTAEGVYFIGGGNIFVRLNSSRASTVKDFKEWVADSNLNIQYILATPIMRNLTEDKLAAINTSYPSTTVYNDAGADMEVKYVADTKLYVDNKFNVLAAMINA